MKSSRPVIPTRFGLCRRLLRAILVLLAASLGGRALAQTEAPDSTFSPGPAIRPVLSVFTLEMGSMSVRDTYLTPLRYAGWHSSLGYERMQAMRFDPERWIMQLDARLALGRALNPAKSALMWQIDFRPSWSMMWRARLPHGFTLAAGGTASADLGVLFLPRNGNNPASAKASLTVGATGFAAWNGRIGRLPVTLKFQPKLPLAGVFFSPDYDELYYEIWLGNHSGLTRLAWPGNYFRLDSQLTADLHFGATTLRIGYRCDFFSGKAGDIVNRAVTHTAVIGVATELVSLRAGSSRTPDVRIISALY